MHFFILKIKINKSVHSGSAHLLHACYDQPLCRVRTQTLSFPHGAHSLAVERELQQDLQMPWLLQKRSTGDDESVGVLLPTCRLYSFTYSVIHLSDESTYYVACSLLSTVGIEMNQIQQWLPSYKVNSLTVEDALRKGGPYDMDLDGWVGVHQIERRNFKYKTIRESSVLRQNRGWSFSKENSCQKKKAI